MTLTLQASATAPLPGQTPIVSYYSVSQPAAGSDWSATVPANQTWIVQAAEALLVTAATVADRIPLLEANPPGASGYIAVPPGTVAASLSVVFSWAIGAGTVAAGSTQGVALPAVPMPPGAVIGPNTVSLQAGDQWRFVSLAVLVYK